MRRTSQLVGLDFSTGRSISPLPVMASVAKARLIFMAFRELLMPAWECGHRLETQCIACTAVLFVHRDASSFQYSREKALEWSTKGAQNTSRSDGVEKNGNHLAHR